MIKPVKMMWKVLEEGSDYMDLEIQDTQYKELESICEEIEMSGNTFEDFYEEVEMTINRFFYKEQIFL